MNLLDWILIALALLCLVRGITRGAIAQLFGIAGVVGGLILAAQFYGPLSKQLATVFPELAAKELICFLGLFLLAWFCIGCAGFLLGRMLRRTALGFLDRLGGAAIGLLKAAILAVFVISALTLLLTPKHPVLAKSLLRPYLRQAAQQLARFAPDDLQKLFDDKQKQIKDYWQDDKGREQEKESNRTGEKAKSI
jgi:membrane protein required for colicin V production